MFIWFLVFNSSYIILKWFSIYQKKSIFHLNDSNEQLSYVGDTDVYRMSTCSSYSNESRAVFFHWLKAIIHEKKQKIHFLHHMCTFFFVMLWHFEQFNVMRYVGIKILQIMSMIVICFEYCQNFETVSVRFVLLCT